MNTWLGLIVWLVFGWFFTVWFVNYFLDDHRFVDCDEEVGAGTLIMLNLVGPLMAVVIALGYTIHFMGQLRINKLVRKAYCIR